MSKFSEERLPARSMLFLVFEDELTEDEPDAVFIVEDVEANELALLPLVVAGK